MATQPQTSRNRLSRPSALLNLGHFDFETVSDFGIGVSDFSLSRLLQISGALCKSPLFAQNKPNSPSAKTTATAAPDHNRSRTARGIRVVQTFGFQGRF